MAGRPIADANDESPARHALIHRVPFTPSSTSSTFDEETGDSLIRDLAGDRKVLEWNMARGFVHFDNKASMTPDYKDLSAALDNWLDQDMDNHFLIVKDAHLALRDNALAIARLKALAHRII